MFSVVAVSVATMGLNVAVATGPVTTSVTPNYDGGSNPDSSIFVKGKWEMLNLVAGDPGVGEKGRDDNTADGAQFDAPGVWGANMNYTVCAIVRGPNDYIDNIRDVYAEIYYPTDRPMHTSGITCDDYNCVTGCYNDDPVEIDNPSGGCGAHIEQNNLHRLNQLDGYNLVCNELRVNNTNLPEWATGYDPNLGGSAGSWEELCGLEGELTKSWAAVYCSDKDITWEDPAGDYRVTVTAYDTEDNQSNVLENSFTYQEHLGFEIDFNSVDYGVVSISEHKMIAGNKIFKENDGSSLPTVRNTGNVRLNMKIAQDDMGLGMLEDGSDWRPEYDARVGDLYENLVSYDPFGAKGTTPTYPCDYTTLDEILDLSEIEEMDLSIHVKEKWPLNLPSYSGTMWLGANRADFELCNG